MARKGETWNESETYRDAWTLREVRRITRFGVYNQTPTYHTNVGFTADGEFLVFVTCRDGASAVCRCHVPTGDVTQLTEAHGIGGHGALHKGNGSTIGDGGGVEGGGLCVAPRSGWCVHVRGRAVRAVHLETLEERDLIPDVGEGWLAGIPSVDPEEQHVLVPVVPGHPQILAGERVSRTYMECWAEGGIRTRFLQVPLEGGPAREVHLEEGCSCAHSPHCPTDPDLVLVDRDFPPRFWAGSDGVTNRTWTLNLKTHRLLPLYSRDRARFQVHSVWTWDGRAVLYHGRSAESGYYVGAVSREGETIREYHLPKAEHYGHVSADPKRPAVILDGNVSPEMLVWLFYDAEQPRIEVIARHGTDWGALPGQYPHPHPLADPTGRWISFNVGSRGRSDVCVVRV